MAHVWHMQHMWDLAGDLLDMAGGPGGHSTLPGEGIWALLGPTKQLSNILLSD